MEQAGQDTQPTRHQLVFGTEELGHFQPDLQDQCAWIEYVKSFRHLAQCTHPHNLCINKSKPSCTPYSFWSQYGMPCCHTMLIIGTPEPTLLLKSREEFFEHYFHPSFNVKSLVTAYKRGSSSFPMPLLGHHCQKSST